MSSFTNGRTRNDVIVIGAGHNGLTAAALLAKRGRKVLVVERREVIGGLAAGEEFHPGYRTVGLLHDTTGVRPAVADGLDLARHGFSRTPQPPPIFAPQRDGPGLLLQHEPSAAAAELRAISARDAERYGEYRAFFDRVGSFGRRLFDAPPPELTDGTTSSLLKLLGSGLALRRLGRRDMTELLRLVPMCVADWLNEWFDTELLKCLLAGPALYGTNTGPWSPGSNALLFRAEVTGRGAVRGGPQALIDALSAAARTNGVEIRTAAAVQRIRVADGAVAGVTLADGETLDAPVVVSSCDPRHTFLHLVAARHLAPGFDQRINAYRMHGTTAKVNLALRGPLRFACRPDIDVEYARTGETLDEMEHAFDPTKYGRFATAPLLDIHVPTISDPALAPSGHSVVSVLAHFAPYGLRGGWTEEQRDALGDAVVKTLQHYAPDVEQRIVAREVLTPLDIERRYGVTGGHVHHGEHGLDQLLVRPTPECARYATPIAGLYLCGGGTHPGGGLTCAPGALAAATVVKASEPRP